MCTGVTCWLRDIPGTFQTVGAKWRRPDAVTHDTDFPSLAIVFTACDKRPAAGALGDSDSENAAIRRRLFSECTGGRGNTAPHPASGRSACGPSRASCCRSSQRAGRGLPLTTCAFHVRGTVTLRSNHFRHVVFPEQLTAHTAPQGRKVVLNSSARETERGTSVILMLSLLHQAVLGLPR